MPRDKLCAIIFDEMSIIEAIIYNKEVDNVEGFQDLGSLGISLINY